VGRIFGFYCADKKVKVRVKAKVGRRCCDRFQRDSGDLGAAAGRVAVRAKAPFRQAQGPEQHAPASRLCWQPWRGVASRRGHPARTLEHPASEGEASTYVKTSFPFAEARERVMGHGFPGRRGAGRSLDSRRASGTLRQSGRAGGLPRGDHPWR
jgi:hypothetical protein